MAAAPHAVTLRTLARHNLLLGTPKRLANMLAEEKSGYRVDLDAMVNGAKYALSYEDPIAVPDIQFYTMCEHHMLSYEGKAHVAYTHSDRVVGLSKIHRVVEVFARRLQVQERMTQEIADFAHEKLQPRRIAVMAEGVHSCAVMRGVNQPEGVMQTQACVAGSDVVQN